ncbi:pseudouridine synthase [Rheinheimera marina]|uniref:Pseudouridine synthase n=1 Tax=Rheinheimera marina TaxID=1774958 RepID=A0ABV9JLA3_9GAMM
MSKANTPSEITLPASDQGWRTVLAFLCAHFHRIAPQVWQQRVLDGKVYWYDSGEPITPDTLFKPSRRVCYFREVTIEPQIPFEHQLLYRDEHIVLACKPHFLPVIPGGDFVNECLLERLKRDTGLTDLVPVHRLDNETAGLVLFSCNPQSRAAYYQLFAEGKVEKTYQAVAELPPALQQADLPMQWRVQNRIEKSEPRFLMRQWAGDVNADSSLSLVACREHLGLFELCPHTGKTHQLRLHMQQIGCPILWDKYYPQLQPKQRGNFSQPLQLLAQRLHFTDPISGAEHQFQSSRQLQSWPL